MENPKVVTCGGQRAVKFAAEELRRYLEMTGAEGAGEIHVGQLSAFAAEPLMVENPEWDDAVDIQVKNAGGHVAGVNPRSVLLAVYRYLTEIGCRWVRPGPDGEFIPKLESLPDVSLREVASYRHRGICSEGSMGIEHIKSLVDWMPKVGFNCYFSQFRESYFFWDRWHGKKDDPAIGGNIMPRKDAVEYTRRTVEELKKRDMLWHAVGHGWTCEAVGIPGFGWEQEAEEPPESASKYFAQLNGERKLWGGVAINTNLCYGNPEARQLIAKEIAGYAEKHPEIDVLHFWLADGSNNNCECELCRDHRVSDLYVKTFNELDELMTAKGIKTRIVFLIYVDLMWPPVKEKIANPDRFILMFAPITRTYGVSFTPSAELPPIPPYELNKLQFPTTVEGNIAFLKGWQENFKGDSFDFDYHMMWDYNVDSGFTRVARILSEDMRNLGSIGLNGLVSCQAQRVFFPTGLPMTVMGRTMWDRNLDYEKLADDYYAAAFGQDGGGVKKYLATLTELFDYSYMRGEKPKVDADVAAGFARARDVIREFQPFIERNLGQSNACWAKSWEYLMHHAIITDKLAQALKAKASGDDDAARKLWEETKAYASEQRPLLHPAFDIFNFVACLNGQFG